MTESRRVDVVYAGGRWLAWLGTDADSHFDHATLLQLIEAMQAATPEQAILFVVNYLTIEYHRDAELQFIEAKAKNWATVAASVERI